MDMHPFSRFVAILARGKTHVRDLTADEAREAMAMILRGEALPEQIGAFLMLLRLKEESSEEIAGFTQGARTTLPLPDVIPSVDLDWSSYAGKRRQLPWFVLSALTLSENGIKVFMHGTEGHTPGRKYTRDCLEALGFPIASDLAEAARHIEADNFAYVPLEVLSPKLKELIELRPILGLRSPVHSFSRMLNPFNAPCMMQGIFHRGFMDIHAGAAKILEQPRMSVFRGEGGEIERRPNKPCEVWSVFDGETTVERWPAMLPEPFQPADEDMDIENLGALWRGDIEDAYGEAAVTGTLAIALRTLGLSETQESAQEMAKTWWAGRDMTRIPGSV